MKRNKDKTPIICRCNNVSRGTLETAIREGCDTMNKIFDATTAGVGPCGGSCRRKILPMLDQYLKTGTFPEKIVEDTTGKVSPKAASSTAASSTATAASPAAAAGAPTDSKISQPATANIADNSSSHANSIGAQETNQSVSNEIKKPNSSGENR